MSLDRRAIEKRDFPTRLRGYDRAAVDAHLRELADELEARAGTTLAASTGEHVHAVIAAAEASGAEILRAAEREAAELRAQASAAASSARAMASREQRDRAERVVASSSATLARLDALRGELAALLDALGGADAVAEVAPDAPAPPADEDGARLVALELALSGAAREEADRALAEHFRLDDRAALLDDVYATVER